MAPHDEQYDRLVEARDAFRARAEFGGDKPRTLRAVTAQLPDQAQATARLDLPSTPENRSSVCPECGQTRVLPPVAQEARTLLALVPTPAALPLPGSPPHDPVADPLVTAERARIGRVTSGA